MTEQRPTQGEVKQLDGPGRFCTFRLRRSLLTEETLRLVSDRLKGRFYVGGKDLNPYNGLNRETWSFWMIGRLSVGLYREVRKTEGIVRIDERW